MGFQGLRSTRVLRWVVWIYFRILLCSYWCLKGLESFSRLRSQEVYKGFTGFSGGIQGGCRVSHGASAAVIGLRLWATLHNNMRENYRLRQLSSFTLFVIFQFEVAAGNVGNTLQHLTMRRAFQEGTEFHFSRDHVKTP